MQLPQTHGVESYDELQGEANPGAGGFPQARQETQRALVGTVLYQKEQGQRHVQTNLISPHPRRGLALKDTTGWRVNSSFLQQSNVQPHTRRPPGKKPAARQNNLGLIMATSSPPQGSHRALAHLSPWPQNPEPRPTAGYAPPYGCTGPGTRFLGSLRGQTSRLTGEPLTLEDLAIPAQTQAQHPSCAVIHQLLASVQRLEWQAAHLRDWASWKPRGPTQQGPCLGNGQAFPTHLQHSRPVLASSDKRRHSHGHKETADPCVTQGTHTGHSDSWASNGPASPKTSLGMWTGHFHDSGQGVLPAQPLRPEHEGTLGPTCGRACRENPAASQGSGSKEAWPGSSAFSSAATARRVLSRREEVHIPREPGEGTALGPPDEALARRGVFQNEARDSVGLEACPTASRQLLSRCFRAWICVAQRQRAAVAAMALRHRRLLREGFRGLRWTLWLQEARMEVAGRRHAKTLLAQTFREWRLLVVDQKEGQLHVQPASRRYASWASKDQVVRLERDAAGCPTPRSRAGSLRREEGAQPPPSKPGQRPDSGDDGDGGDRRVQTLQVLQQLAVFLLWCQKDQARKEMRSLGKVTQRTQRTDVSPAASQPKRDWLCRCFWAWRRIMQREALCQGHLADHCRRTMRVYLEQWVRMKQLRASDAVKVTALSLCRWKAGNLALQSSARGLETVSLVSLQGACRRLALRRALLLWQTRLSQHQQANSFFQGTRERTVRCILNCWCVRVWGVNSLSGSSVATLVLEPLSSVLGGPLEPPTSWTLTVTGLYHRTSTICPARCGVQRGNASASRGRSLLLGVGWAARGGSDHPRVDTLLLSTLLTQRHWTPVQGTWREVAAHQAWHQSCRVALGLWQWQLAGTNSQTPDNRSWVACDHRIPVTEAFNSGSLVAASVPMWLGTELTEHPRLPWRCLDISLAPGQRLLREKHKCQSWVHGHLQKVMFQGWWQEVAQRRHLTR
ncbi:uncharacterized protein C1orf167 homolog [Octodon degus]|uniref:Uncharacterized protein C1orf167 homolog n=1 Tax=Octodon degus TaxID=10160 RepID=A0A6P6D4W4_OCTDE|nr:uncharacterized protein C1orf167 homolog [Octodon degus]